MSSIDTSVLLAFALLWAVIVPTPGANSLMVAHIALSRGRRHMLAAVGGNMIGIALLGGAALLGLALMLETLPWLRRAVTIGGAIYLVYFGLRLILANGTPTQPSHAAGAGNGDAMASASPEAASREHANEPLSRSVGIGLLTSLSNAQAIIFVSSIFAVSGVLAANLATGLACVATMIVMNASYLLALGSLLLLPAPRRLYLRFIAPIRRLFGVIFAALGLRLIWRELVQP